MITYKIIPNLNQSKTGLAISLAGIDQDKIRLAVSTGSFTRGQVNSELLETKELELSCFAYLDVDFYVMLAKKISDQSIDILLVQYSRVSNGMATAQENGYELITVLAEGKNPTGNSQASGVSLTEYIWV
jgi:hypothetical protein